jgi:hypothetical protein
MSSGIHSFGQDIDLGVIRQGAPPRQVHASTGSEPFEPLRRPVSQGPGDLGGLEFDDQPIGECGTAGIGHRGQGQQTERNETGHKPGYRYAA